MRRDLAGIILGVICLGGAAVWMAISIGVFGVRHGGLALAIVMLLAGSLGLILPTRRSRRPGPGGSGR